MRCPSCGRPSERRSYSFIRKAARSPRVDSDAPGRARRRVLKAGVVAYNDRHVTLPCTVRDLSATGARVRVEGSVSAPDTFELIIDIDGFEANCQVVWRKGNEIGVRFLGAPRMVAPKRHAGHQPDAADAESRRCAASPSPASRPKPASDRPSSARVLLRNWLLAHHHAGVIGREHVGVVQHVGGLSPGCGTASWASASPPR